MVFVQAEGICMSFSPTCICFCRYKKCQNWAWLDFRILFWQII